MRSMIQMRRKEAEAAMGRYAVCGHNVVIEGSVQLPTDVDKLRKLNPEREE